MEPEERRKVEKPAACTGHSGSPGYHFFSRIGGILRFFELREDRRQLQQEIHRLEAEKMELEEQIELLKKNDPKVIEREARKLGMIFEDETVYRLKYEAVPDSE